MSWYKCWFKDRNWHIYSEKKPRIGELIGHFQYKLTHILYIQLRKRRGTLLPLVSWYKLIWGIYWALEADESGIDAANIDKLVGVHYYITVMKASILREEREVEQERRQNLAEQCQNLATFSKIMDDLKQLIALVGPNNAGL